MKVRIIQTLQRTIELDVDEATEQAAIASGLLTAAEIQPADWDYTWKPITEEGCALS
jgi:hypothetical protein